MVPDKKNNEPPFSTGATSLVTQKPQTVDHQLHLELIRVIRQGRLWKVWFSSDVQVRGKALCWRGEQRAFFLCFFFFSFLRWEYFFWQSRLFSDCFAAHTSSPMRVTLADKKVCNTNTIGFGQECRSMVSSPSGPPKSRYRFLMPSSADIFSLSKG